jgi:membrane-associated phospholipid phosphatase
MSARIPENTVDFHTARTEGRRLAALFAGALLLFGLLLRWDVALMAARPVSPALEDLAQVLSHSADGKVLFPVGVLVLGVFAAVRRIGWARWIGAMLLGAILCGLLANVFRGLIGRTRPEAPVEQGWFGPRKDGHWIVGKHAYSSFPSGHTAAAGGFGLILFLRGRRWGVIGAAYALSVAWSRVQLGVHRPSDVAAGLLLSAVVIFLVRDRLRAFLGIHFRSDWAPFFPIGSGPRKAQGLADDSQDLVPT